MTETGISPKQLARTFRFENVVTHLAAGSQNLADVAAATGYADQGHLTREFRRMVGRSRRSGFSRSAETSKTAGTARGQDQGMTEQTTTDDALAGQAPPATVWGTFQARDAHAMIGFLTAIGFVATAVYADGDTVHHAQLDWPEGGGVMFGSHQPEGWSLPPGGAGFYVVTADPRAVHDRAVQAGAVITREVAEPGYGGLEFGLRDPEGNLWSFGSYRGEPRATESSTSG